MYGWERWWLCAVVDVVDQCRSQMCNVDESMVEGCVGDVVCDLM